MQLSSEHKDMGDQSNNNPESIYQEDLNHHTTPEWANQQKSCPEKWYTTYCQGPLGLPKNAFGQI